MNGRVFRYQARRHPVVTFLALLVLGPYLLAAALLVLMAYAAVSAISVLGRK